MSFLPIQLDRRVLINELIDADEPAAHSHEKLGFLDADCHLALAELVNTVCLPDEVDFELSAVRVTIQKLSEDRVDVVVAVGHVDRRFLLHINDVGLQAFTLFFGGL